MRYEYIIKSDSGTDYVLYADGGVVKSSNINASSGQIIPNTYVGTLKIQIKEQGREEEVGNFEIEVRSSRKAEYRTEYRFMLEEITEDRKSTRLNSSHVANSYAVFCLKIKRTVV